jgi:hypothetical protein
VAAGGYGGEAGNGGWDGAMERCDSRVERVVYDYPLWRKYSAKLEAYCRRIGQDASDRDLGHCEAARFARDQRKHIDWQDAVGDPSYEIDNAGT